VEINATLVNGLTGNYKEAAVLNAVAVNKSVLALVSVFVIYPHLWTTVQEKPTELFHVTLIYVQYGPQTAAAAVVAAAAAAAKAAAAKAEVEAAVEAAATAMMLTALNLDMKDGGTIKQLSMI